MRWILSFFVFSLLFAPAAQAQKYDTSHRDWSVYTHKNICYIGSAPIKQAGNYSRRGQPYMLVVHRGKTLEEINISSGYPYAPKSKVTVAIDGTDYSLFTEGETAWAYDSAQDREMVRAMRGGNKMTIKGKSAKGTWSEDTYSLMGFSAAHKRMKRLCK